MSNYDKEIRDLKRRLHRLESDHGFQKMSLFLSLVSATAAIISLFK